MKVPRVSTWNAGERRPTILLADDHVRVLESASRLLAEDFEVVAAVTDGRQALNAARRLDPDVVVLDVTMPGLDGFETARELKRVGSRARVVFLTMHHGDEYVAAAVRSGGQGYVLKMRLQLDLASAVDHALAGRLFVPSLTSLSTIAQDSGGGGHAVHFRADDRASLGELSGLLSAALRQGDLAAVVATEATRAGIAERLNANGCDIAEAAGRGRYVSLDAADALAQFMREGRPDADRVAAIVDDLDRSRLAAGTESRLTIVGEMGFLLCRDANPDAAIQLERLWTDLTRGLPFLTVCSYPMECFGRAARPALFSSVCAEHRAVCHTHDA